VKSVDGGDADNESEDRVEILLRIALSQVSTGNSINTPIEIKIVKKHMD